MCGHGAIGVATVAVATGMVAAVEPETAVVLDTPAGTVRCRVAVEGGRPRAVTITNVPSFLFRQRAIVPVPGFGKVAADIAWGGNWFAFVEASQLGLCVDKAHLQALMPAAAAVRQALLDSGVRGVHPQRGGEEVVDHVKLFVELHGERAPGARALTLCPGAAYDRSPCGTGTSAKLACLAADGHLAAGVAWSQESVIGSRFEGRWTPVEGQPGRVLPSIRGRAWITAEATLLRAGDDPFRDGIRA
jgi:4-hydroxyproline epimerase